MEFYRVREIKACRKQKHCLWCWEFILVGQPKAYVSGKFEGDFFHADFHPECQEARVKWWDLERLKRPGSRAEHDPDDGSMVRGSTEYKKEKF